MELKHCCFYTKMDINAMQILLNPTKTPCLIHICDIMALLHKKTDENPTKSESSEFTGVHLVFELLTSQNNKQTK